MFLENQNLAGEEPIFPKLSVKLMYKLSYWNVDTQKIGKLKEDKNEMKEVQLNILGIGEIW